MGQLQRLFAGMAFFACVLSATIHRPADASALTTALSSAACGDTIVLAAGTNYRGTFTVANKACTASSPLVIQGNKIYELPEGKRVTWADRGKMPVIETTSANQALIIGTAVQHVIIRGVAFSNYWPTSNTVTPDLISSDGATVSPRNLTFDRVIAYPYEEVVDPTYPFRSAERFLTMTGTEILVKNSYIAGFMGWYRNRTQQAISTVTAGATTTLDFTAVHGWGASGSRIIYVEGGTGSWTGANGKWTATIVDTNTVTIPVDSSGFGAVTGTFTARDINSDALTLSRGLTFPAGPGPYRVINNYIAAQYTATFWGGPTSTRTDNEATVTASTGTTNATLSQVSNLAVGDMIAISPNVLRVSTITSANPAVVTFNAAHGFGSAGATYKVNFQPGANSASVTSGIPPTGGSWYSGWGNLQGVKTVTVVDATRVSVAVDASGYTAYASAQGQASYGGVVAYDINQSTDAVNGCNRYASTTQSNTYCSMRVTAISGNEITMEEYGPSARGRVGAIWPGARARWNGTKMRGNEVRRNTFGKGSGWCTSLFGSSPCKGYDEVKEFNGIYAANILDDGLDSTSDALVGGTGMGPARNQECYDPWIGIEGTTVEDNRGRINSSGTGTFDDGCGLKIEYKGQPVRSRNNLFLDSPGNCYKINTTNDLQVTNNTCWQRPPNGSYSSWMQVIEAGTYSVGGFALGAPNAIISGNIGKWNTYGFPDNNSNARTGSTATHNLFLDNLSQFAGTSLGAGYDSTNKALDTSGDIGFSGTCDWTNWRNCKIVSGTYLGYFNGVNPGADLERLEDRAEGWSEDSGLIVYGLNEAVNNPAAFMIGSTRAAITFRLLSGGTCELVIYTDAIRSTEHGDTNTSGEKLCTRTGNVSPDKGRAVFVLGTNTALTASTTYYYKLTVGSAVMVGSFTTRASGSGQSWLWNRARECGTDGSTFGTAVSANTPYSVAAGNVRYCRDSAGAPVDVVIAP